MLADSGVAELEARVLAFLYRHSGALRLLATIDDAAQLLLQARTRTLTASAASAGCVPPRSTTLCCCVCGAQACKSATEAWKDSLATHDHHFVEACTYGWRNVMSVASGQ